MGLNDLHQFWDLQCEDFFTDPEEFSTLLLQEQLNSVKVVLVPATRSPVTFYEGRLEAA